MALKIISYEDLVKLAREYGAKTSTAERRLRKGEAWDLPVQKLNKNKKPLKDGDYIAYYKYIGGSVWKKSQSKKSLKKLKK